MNTVPQVMISSTFFDLKQVRADLARFLGSQLGCKPLLSEWPSFPIDPDVDTIENCRRRVELEADVLVLVIGGRYGYVDSRSSASVTNIEYLAARAKGIPIYAFVERRVLALLPVWEANKGIDFSSTVDDSRVFDFIGQVRDVHKVWTREFDLASEIVDALREQFAYLALQGVRFMQKLREERGSSLPRELSGVPLRIALERPLHWEYRLVAEVLRQEVESHRYLREQVRVGLNYGPHEIVSVESFDAWRALRMAELSRMLAAIDSLVNRELRRAFGSDQIPADAELLVFVARSLGGLYQEGIEWGRRVRRAVPDDDLKPAVCVMERFWDDVLEKLESLGPLLLDQVKVLEEARRRGELEPKLSLVIDTQLLGADQFREEVDRFSRKLEEKSS